MNWLLENKEWIFSGIGVSIVIFILNNIFNKKHYSQKQKGGNKSKNYQSGGNININNKKDV